MTKLDFPDTPTTGNEYGSSGNRWRWDGTRWGSTNGSAGARGVVGYAQITASIAGYGGTTTDIYGCSVTPNLVAGRTYKVTGHVLYNPGAANNYATLYLCNGTNAVLNQSTHYLPVTNATFRAHEEHVFTATVSGPFTLKLMTQGALGSTGLTVYASPSIPTFILVEDVTYEAGYGAPYMDVTLLPRGLVCRPAVIQANQGLVGTTPANLTGFTQTFTAVAGRMYECTYGMTIQHDATNNFILRASIDGAQIVIASFGTIPGGTLSNANGSFQFYAGTPGQFGNIVPSLPPGAGKVIQLNGYTAPSGTVTIGNATWTNGRMSLKDIGPGI